MNCECRLCLARNIGRYDIAEEEARGRILDEPSEGIHYANLANILLLQNRIDEALVSAEQAVEYSPDCPDSMYWLAEVKQQMGYYDEAVEILKRGIQLDPEDESLWERLAAIHNFRGDYESGLQYAKQSVELNPGFVHGHFAVVEAHCYRDPFSGEAVVALETMMRLAPDDEHAHELHATLLIEQGEPEQALAAAYTALSINPVDEQVLGTLLTLETDHEKLRMLAQQANDLNRNVNELDLVIALTFVALQMDEEAVQAMERIKIDERLANGGQASAYVELATILRRYDLVLKFCDYLTQSDQESAIANSARATIACEKREYEQAYDFACRASQAEPDSYEAMWGRVFAEIATGRIAEASTTAKELMEFDSVSGNFINGLIESTECVGRGDKYLRIAADDETSWRDLTTTRCDAILDLLEMNFQDAAIELLQVLEQEHGYSCETWCTRAVVELWLGELVTAKASFEKSIENEPTCENGAEIYRRAFWLFHDLSNKSVDLFQRPAHWGPVEIART